MKNTELKTNGNNEVMMYTVFGTDGYHNLVCRSYYASSYEEMCMLFYKEFRDGDIADYVEFPVEE